MTEKPDVIAQSLGLTAMPEKTQVQTIEPKKLDNNDYDYARQNLYDVIEKGTNALEDILDIAKQSESARAFEVATNLMKTMVDANKDLLELAKAKKDLERVEAGPEKQVTNNNLILTSAELLKLIKNQNEQ